ncbi:hypothetical protein [Nocardioides sp.]|uniref:hypothetical protein n=1 Tax=Nocardioides sp. TaxID=35761 RepID=UPI003561CAFD
MSLYRIPGGEPAARLTLVSPPETDLCTPYEAWCEVNGIHPEAPGAWERFSSEQHLRPSA